MTDFPSPMLKRLISQNTNKEYPSNLGKIWSVDEEIWLLEELQEDIDLIAIAENHKRTVGGIIGRQKEIAYKMYLQHIDILQIQEKTKLTYDTIIDVISKKENTKKIMPRTEYTEMKVELDQLKKEIKIMKTDIEQLKNKDNSPVHSQKEVLN